MLLNRALLTKNNETNLTDFGIVRAMQITLFFSNYWPLLSNILAVSQVLEDRHCLKRNKYTSLHLNSSVILMALSRFLQAKTAEEENNLVHNGVPKATQYKNKRAYGIFEEWQRQRLVKVPIVQVVCLVKSYDYHHAGVVPLILKSG